MFLSTKLIPRSDGEILQDKGESEDADGRKSHVEAVERFNDSVDDISTTYQASAEDVLSKLLVPSGSGR